MDQVEEIEIKLDQLIDMYVIDRQAQKASLSDANKHCETHEVHKASGASRKRPQQAQEVGVSGQSKALTEGFKEKSEKVSSKAERDSDSCAKKENDRSEKIKED